jgi:hypothetical protein
MSSTCNVINVNQIKVSDLVRYSTLTTKDFILTIESGSSNDLYSRRSTFGDIAKYLSNITSSFTGSFSGSAKLIGKFTGSFSGSFRGKSSGSFSGSMQGFLLSKTAKLTGSFSGSTFGTLISKTAKLTGSFSGSTFGTLISKNAKLTGSFKGSLTGSFIGKSTGSFSGSTFGALISKNAKLTGSFSGSYFGKILSKNSNLTGSLTGSFRGYISASNKFNSSQKAAFYGTSSWAKNADVSLITNLSVGNPTGTGTANYSTYWSTPDILAGNDYFRRNSVTSVPDSGGAAGWPGSTGRNVLYRPLWTNNYVGTHLIQFSASTSNQYTYDIGLQYSTNYIRTGANFAIYYSGSINQGESLAFGKDALWRPDTAEKTGFSGWTSFGVRQRLVSVGHFGASYGVQAQLHVHLSGSKGWPSNYVDGAGTIQTYRPLENVFLITSGSSYTKLLKVSGSGQLDVKGDIVAFSTFATSDERLKYNIKPIENSIDKVSSLNPVSFVWSTNNQSDFGLIAQEVEKIYPEFVKENMSGFKTIKYNSLIALLIKSVQDLKAELDDLKSKIK